MFKSKEAHIIHIARVHIRFMVVRHYLYLSNRNHRNTTHQPHHRSYLIKGHLTHYIWPTTIRLVSQCLTNSHAIWLKIQNIEKALNHHSKYLSQVLIFFMLNFTCRCGKSIHNYIVHLCMCLKLFSTYPQHNICLTWMPQGHHHSLPTVMKTIIV